MTSKTKVAYFPVIEEEQAILERIRRKDLAARRHDVLNLLDILAEAGTAPADLEQALVLLEAARSSEGLDARFENLEARLARRLEDGLAEIEGRLAKSAAAGGGEPRVPGPQPPPPPRPPGRPPTSKPAVPENANLAFVVAGELVWGTSGTKFYQGIWKWLIEHGHLSAADLPVGATKKRFMAAATPVHPTGKDFFLAKEVVQGLWIETNLSRGDMVRKAKKLLTMKKVPFEVLVGPTMS